MDYTLTLYLNQYWRDDRLIFGNEDEEMTLTGEIIDKFWLPDTFFPNDKSAYLHDVTEKNKMIRWPATRPNWIRPKLSWTGSLTLTPCREKSVPISPGLWHISLLNRVISKARSIKFASCNPVWLKLHHNYLPA